MVNKKKEPVIVNGFDVSECPHINAYFPDKPKCQQGMGVGGCGSDCRGDCRYTEKLAMLNIEKEYRHYYKESKRLFKENKSLKKLLKRIDKKLEKALDAEQLDMEESLDLLYEIQDLISEVENER